MNTTKIAKRKTPPMLRWSAMTAFENQVLSEIIWRRKYAATDWKVNDDVRCSTNLYWMEYIQGCSMGKEV
jgi:hypothetical protein